MHLQRYVIAYDISSTRRRNRVVKILKDLGVRVNLSVFECDLEKEKLIELRKQLQKIIKKNKDIVIYYPLCMNCLSAVITDGIRTERCIMDQATLMV